MIIGVAGPYSAPPAQQRQANLHRMNAVAARLLEMGHSPVIGMNAALPVIAQPKMTDTYEAVIRIPLAVISACDALLLLGENPVANRERDLMLALNKPVHSRLEDVPMP